MSRAILRQRFLLLGHGHSLEDAVVAAADAVCLVVGKVTVLRHFHIVHGEVSGNAVNSGGDIRLVQHETEVSAMMWHTP